MKIKILICIPLWRNKRNTFVFQSFSLFIPLEQIPIIMLRNMYIYNDKPWNMANHEDKSTKVLFVLYLSSTLQNIIMICMWEVYKLWPPPHTQHVYKKDHTVLLWVQNDCKPVLHIAVKTPFPFQVYSNVLALVCIIILFFLHLYLLLCLFLSFSMCGGTRLGRGIRTAQPSALRLSWKIHWLLGSGEWLPSLSAWWLSQWRRNTKTPCALR